MEEVFEVLSGGEKNGSISEKKEDKGQGREKCVGDNRVLVTYRTSESVL